MPPIIDLPPVVQPRPLLPRPFPVPPFAGPKGGYGGDNIIPFPPMGPQDPDDSCGDNGCKKDQERLLNNRAHMQAWIDRMIPPGVSVMRHVIETVQRAVKQMNKSIAEHNARCPANQVPPLVVGPRA